MAGMAGTLFANLERNGIPLKEIRYGLATHYHIDHAGAAQDLKQAGVPLLVLEEQLAAIPQMKRWTKPRDNYTEITLHDNVVISSAESCAFLAQCGIAGQILHTPGHSDDSVTLVLDNGMAFTGDLTREEYVATEDPASVARSWQSLRERGVTMVYGGHGAPRPIPPPRTRD